MSMLKKMYNVGSAKLRQFVADEKAAVALEYGLIAMLIGLVIVVAFTWFGKYIEAGFATVDNTISKTGKNVQNVNDKITATANNFTGDAPKVSGVTLSDTGIQAPTV